VTAEGEGSVRCFCASAELLDFDDHGLTPNGRSLRPEIRGRCPVCGNRGRTSAARLRVWKRERVGAATAAICAAGALAGSLLAVRGSTGWGPAGIAVVLALAGALTARSARRALRRDVGAQRA